MMMKMTVMTNGKIMIMRQSNKKMIKATTILILIKRNTNNDSDNSIDNYQNYVNKEKILLQYNDERK